MLVQLDDHHRLVPAHLFEAGAGNERKAEAGMDLHDEIERARLRVQPRTEPIALVVDPYTDDAVVERRGARQQRVEDLAVADGDERRNRVEPEPARDGGVEPRGILAVAIAGGPDVLQPARV